MGKILSLSTDLYDLRLVEAPEQRQLLDSPGSLILCIGHAPPLARLPNSPAKGIRITSPTMAITIK
jgi:hypothetical protein